MRVRFSLRILLLIIALLLVIASHVVLGIRYSALQRERDASQRERDHLLGRLGAIQRRDDERLLMHQMDTGVTFHRKWNLFIPKGRTYAVFMELKNIPTTGKVMGQVQPTHEFVGDGSEITVSLAFLQRGERIEVLVRTTLPTSTVDGSMELGKEYWFLFAQNEIGAANDSVGQSATVVENENRSIEFVRLRRPLMNPDGSTAEDPNPCDGLLVWIQEVPPKPKPPGSKSQ